MKEHTPTPFHIKENPKEDTFGIWTDALLINYLHGEKLQQHIGIIFLPENAAFIVRAVNAYEKDQEIIKDLLKALKAQIQMRDTTKPTKLQEALCWRDNDDLANKYAQEAIAKAEGL